MDNWEDVLTAQEAGHLLGISTERVLQYARGGRLSHVRKGKQYLFSRQDVEQFKTTMQPRGRPARRDNKSCDNTRIRLE
ncbi:helix-turn-helix domain-containing protein [Deinococcus proteolyticus]|uniref:helix-turn-helix domain-containing protein n=1 Tax=Deinococcus proteolyticus TaxID=55148 RepID=UPI000A0353F7